MQTGTKLIVTSLACAGMGSAHAARFDYTLELGFLHSDNINLSAADPVTENVLIPRITFGLSEQGSTVQAQIAGALEYREYTGCAYAGEFRATLDGLLNWNLIPERLAWTFADGLGMNPIDLRAPDVQSNLQRTNVFTTGPTLRFRLAPTTLGQVELRFTDSYAEVNTAFDSQRFSGAFRALHDFSSTSRMSLNAEAQHVDFDSALAVDYDTYSAFLGYTRQLSRVDLNAIGGYSHVRFDGGGSAGGPLVRVGADWRATERSSFGLVASRQFTDAAGALGEGAGSLDDGMSGVGIGAAAITPDVYVSSRIGATYAYAAARYSVTGGLHLARFRYELEGAAQGLDRNERGATLDVGYRLRPSTTLGAVVELGRREFLGDAAGVDKQYNYAIYLAQTRTPHWSWRVDLAHNRRNTDEEGNPYRENLAYLRLIYAR